MYTTTAAKVTAGTSISATAKKSPAARASLVRDRAACLRNQPNKRVVRTASSLLLNTVRTPRHTASFLHTLRMFHFRTVDFRSSVVPPFSKAFCFCFQFCSINQLNFLLSTVLLVHDDSSFVATIRSCGTAARLAVLRYGHPHCVHPKLVLAIPLISRDAESRVFGCGTM